MAQQPKRDIAAWDRPGSEDRTVTLHITANADTPYRVVTDPRGHEVYRDRDPVERFPTWAAAARHAVALAERQLDEPPDPVRCGDCGSPLIRSLGSDEVRCPQCGVA